MSFANNTDGHLSWNTGRQYGPEGQVMEAVSHVAGTFFIDHTRQIAGRIDGLHLFTRSAIMAAYDNDDFENIWGSQQFDEMICLLHNFAATREELDATPAEAPAVDNPMTLAEFIKSRRYADAHTSKEDAELIEEIRGWYFDENDAARVMGCFVFGGAGGWHVVALRDGMSDAGELAEASYYLIVDRTEYEVPQTNEELDKLAAILYEWADGEIVNVALSCETAPTRPRHGSGDKAAWPTGVTDFPR